MLTFFLLQLLVLRPVYPGSEPAAAELNSMGMSELESGNNGAAAGYFRQAIAKDPTVKYYYNNLAAAYIRMKDYYSAEKQLLIAIGIDPFYTKALSNMSVVMFRTGRYRDAYDYYTRAKKTDPSYISKRFEREKALERLKEQSRNNPGDSDLKRIIRIIESGE